MDDLDPAFLDLDLPSSSAHHPSLDSLGAGFGTALDNDLDLDLHHHDHGLDELELGGGFGSALQGELGEFGEEDGGGAGTANTHGSLNFHDQLASSNGSGSEYKTPRRRKGSGASSLALGGQGAGGGGGLSLAAELASASGPPGGRTRDLMRELGIEEDGDEEDEEDERDEASEEEDEEERLERQLFASHSGGGAATHGVDDPFAAAGARRSSGTASPRRPGSRLLRTKPSTASFNPSRADSPDEDVEQGMSQEELDAALAEAAAAIEDSVGSTGAFLAHLRQHVTVEVDPSSTVAAPPPPPPPASTTLEVPAPSALSTSLNRSASHSSSPAPEPPLESYTDRQPLLEALSSSLLKQLYAAAAVREAQTRELTELERLAARTEPGWRAVLGGLEPLELSEDEEEQEDAEGRGAEGAPDGQLPPDAALPASPFLDAPSSPPPPPPPSQPSPAASAPHLSLLDLRHTTSSLLSALSSLSEHTQVSSALSSDAARKLRALRQQVAGVQGEVEERGRAEAFVAAYEAREEERGGRGTYAERARREVEGARRALEEGWSRAQSVLRPLQHGHQAHEVGLAM
ncbi:hypothetical protein JCM8097_009386 [Rhodosporidiobolus ruineniae]